MKLNFSIAAFILFLVNISPIFLSLITGFGRDVVFEMPFIIFYIFCLLVAIMGVCFGNKIRIYKFPKFKLLPKNLETIFESKPLLLVVFILILEISYLIIYISSIENFWVKVNELIQFDFYSLRYQLKETTYKSNADGVNKIISTIFKNLDRFLLIAFNAINGYLVNYKRNINRDRAIFLPLSIILISLTIIKGSRTPFVFSIISFLIGLSYGRNLTEKKIKNEFTKTQSKLLKNLKIEKRNFQLLIISTIILGLVIVGKITNDRVGRTFTKIWLRRYERNLGATSKYCNKLCNNTIIAGASGYTISPFLYSKKEFDKQLENSGISEGFGLGYKSFWLPHQAINKFPKIEKITAANKNNWLNNLKYNHPRNFLKRSSWRGLIHDYIFDWGIYFAPVAIFFSFSFVGYLEGLAKRSKGFKSLLCSITSILFALLSIATTPFGPFLPIAILAMII